MGRLDDIAKRNRNASLLESPIISAMAEVAPGKPEPPPPPFTLPSQRRTGFPVWAVILAIAAIIGIYGGYSYWQMDRERTARGDYNP